VSAAGIRAEVPAVDGAGEPDPGRTPVSVPVPACTHRWPALLSGRVPPQCPGGSSPALLVGLAAEHDEALVEVDVDLAAVGPGDLELVVALLVADLGLGDPTTTEWGRAATLARVSGCPVSGVADSSGPGSIRATEVPRRRRVTGRARRDPSRQVVGSYPTSRPRRNPALP